MYKKSNSDLSKIKLGTLLVFPPGAQSYQPHLGIPQLNGFLKSKGYKKLEVIDLQHIGILNVLKLKSNQFRENSLYNPIYEKLSSIGIIKIIFKKFVSTFFNKNVYGKSLIPRSINSIVLSATKFPDKNLPKYKKLIRFIQSKNIGLVGFSVIYPEQLHYSLVISRIIKLFNKNIFIVMGGSQITKNINFLVKEKAISDFVDGFIVNDGEEPLAKLIYQLEYSKKLNDVPNLYFRAASTGYNKSGCSFVPDKSYFIEPVFDKFRFSILPIRASLGCAWGKCSFCTYCLFHKDYLKCDVEALIKIIKNLKKKYGTSNFKITDDFLPPTYLKRLSETLIKEKINIKWTASIALVQGFDESIIDLMEKAGCKKLFAGLESMSGRVLKLMNKPHNPKTAIKIIKLFSESLIKLSVFVMFGFPTETKKEADMTLRFLEENKILFENIVIQQFCLEEDTKVFNRPEKFGISKIYKEDKNYGLRLGYRFDVNTGMTQEESRTYTINATKSLKSNARYMS